MIDTAKKNSSSLKRAGVISLTAALVLSLGASGTAISYLHSADNAATANTVPWHGIDASDMLKIDAMAIEDAGAVLPGKVLDVDAKVQLLPDALDNAYAMVTVKVPSSSQLILEGEKEPTESLKLFDYEVCDGWELVKSQDCTTDDPDTSCILETYAYTGEMAPGDTVDFIDKVQFANISNASNLGKASFNANGGVMTMSLEQTQEISYSNSGWLIDENGHCDIPEGVKVIPEEEFAGSSLSSVTFPSSMEAIGTGSFGECQNLKSITIPSTVKTVGLYAFLECRNLATVNLSEGLVTLDKQAFQDCSSLKSVTLPSTVKKIESMAFLGCTSLESISIPSTIEFVGNNAFDHTNIKYYSDVQGLTKEQLDMLAVNSGALDGSVEYSVPAFPQLTEKQEVQEVTYSKSGWLIDENGHCDVPAGVKTIPSHEFKDRTSLKSVTFQPGTTAINMGAFQGCTSLESIELPSSLIFLDCYVFQGCTSLKSIEIPEGVPTVDECAFQNCTSLSTVKIPSSIIYISSDAFIGTGLTYYSDVSGLTRDQLDMLAKNSGTVDGSQVYPYPAFPQLIDPPTPDYLPMPDNYVIDYHYKAIQTTGFQSYKEAVDVMLSQLDYSKYLG